MKKIKVSIIILNWNTRELLRRCLRSLKTDGKRQKTEIEVIVVDNGSKDGSGEMVKKDFPSVKLITNKTNLGFAKGNNLGVEKANGDLLFFLNSDALANKNAVKILVNCFSQRQKIVAVGPLILNPDRSVQKDPCYLNFPKPLFVLVYYNSILKKIFQRIFPNILYSVNDFTEKHEIAQLSGAALMIERKIFQQVGGFDEGFKLYFEDTDLSWRLKKYGYRLVIEPGAKIVHIGRQSILPIIRKGGVGEFYSLNFRSLFRFCDKNFNLIESFLVKSIIFIYLVLGGNFKVVKEIFFR